MMELYLFVALFFNLCPDVSDGGQVCDAPGVDGGFFGFFYCHRGVDQLLRFTNQK